MENAIALFPEPTKNRRIYSDESLFCRIGRIKDEMRMRFQRWLFAQNADSALTYDDFVKQDRLLFKCLEDQSARFFEIIEAYGGIFWEEDTEKFFQVPKELIRLSLNIINIPCYFYRECSDSEPQKRFLDATCLLFFLLLHDEKEKRSCFEYLQNFYPETSVIKTIKTPEEYFESFLEMRNSWRTYKSPYSFVKKQEEFTGEKWEDRLEAAFRWLLEELKNGTKIDVNPSKHSEYYMKGFLERVGSCQDYLAIINAINGIDKSVATSTSTIINSIDLSNRITAGFAEENQNLTKLKS